MRTLPLALVLAVVASACSGDDGPDENPNTGSNLDGGSGGPATLLASTFDTLGGCGDIRLEANNDAQTHALVIRVPALIDDVRDAGEPLVDSLTFPSDVTATLSIGSLLSSTPCNDALEAGMTVDQVYEAVSGTLDIDVEVTGDAEPFNNPARVDASLHDLVLENEDGDELSVEDFSFTDVNVGWLPG